MHTSKTNYMCEKERVSDTGQHCHYKKWVIFYFQESWL